MFIHKTGKHLICYKYNTEIKFVFMMWDFFAHKQIEYIIIINRKILNITNFKITGIYRTP